MLQQTQVDRVVPRFRAFIDRFPTILELANADEDSVLEAWSGLGYYRRAKNLHRAAQTTTRSGYELPRTLDALLELPGVGPYTAAAVASLAFDVPAPVLDGNVIRVASRVRAHEGDPRAAAGQKALMAWVMSLMESEECNKPGEVNEALMELGAVVCLPKAPQCSRCPLRASCRAHELERIEDFPAQSRPGRPVEEQQWLAACCVDDKGRWLLKRIEEGPVLRRLWLPPLELSGVRDDPVAQARALVPGLRVRVGTIVEPVRHSITYRRISVVPVRFEARRLSSPGDGWVWADPTNPGRPTSSLLGKLARQVDENERLVTK